MNFLRKLFRSQRPLSEAERAQLEAFDQLVTLIDLDIFERSKRLAEARFPGSNLDGIAAHIKLYCTGEGPNKTSISTSTHADRGRGRAIADEIMACEGSGLYGIYPIDALLKDMSELPDDLPSIRRLALTRDEYTLLYLLLACVRGYDARGAPVIDREFLGSAASPLIANLEKYDPKAPVIFTTIAQVYNTLGDVARGMASAIRATELTPSDAEAWRLLGNSYMIQVQDARARECFETALRCDPNIGGVREALALLQVPR